jgi:DNA-binding Lrp family transcriptional regulator
MILLFSDVRGYRSPIAKNSAKCCCYCNKYDQNGQSFRTKCYSVMEFSKYIPDDLDRRLIAHLRIDGRSSLAKLAEILGVARGTVQNRLDRLIDTGTLLGFTVRVREDYNNHTVNAVMMIEVVGKSTSQVIRMLRGYPEISALHTTNGNWDLIANISASSLSDFDRVLREVRMIDGVSNSETSLLLSSV